MTPPSSAGRIGKRVCLTWALHQKGQLNQTDSEPKGTDARHWVTAGRGSPLRAGPLRIGAPLRTPTLARLPNLFKPEAAIPPALDLHPGPGLWRLRGLRGLRRLGRRVNPSLFLGSGDQASRLLAPSGTSFCTVSGRRSRLPFREVYLRLRRQLKCELRLIVRVGDGKVASADDVHADEDISASEAAAADLNLLHHSAIWQGYVNEIDIRLVWIVVGAGMKYLCPAYWFEPTLGDHFLGDRAASCPRIPNGCELGERSRVGVYGADPTWTQ